MTVIVIVCYYQVSLFWLSPPKKRTVLPGDSPCANEDSLSITQATNNDMPDKLAAQG